MKGLIDASDTLRTGLHEAAFAGCAADRVAACYAFSDYLEERDEVHLAWLLRATAWMRRLCSNRITCWSWNWVAQPPGACGDDVLFRFTCVPWFPSCHVYCYARGRSMHSLSWNYEVGGFHSLRSDVDLSAHYSWFLEEFTWFHRKLACSRATGRPRLVSGGTVFSVPVQERK